MHEKDDLTIQFLSIIFHVVRWWYLQNWYDGHTNSIEKSLTNLINLKKELLMKGKIFLTFMIAITAGSNLIASEITDAFTSDGPEIVWTYMWADSMSSPMLGVEDASAPSGDGFAGQMNIDSTYASLGLAYAGSASMTDYAVEADVFLQMNNSYRQSLMTRIGFDESGEAWAYEMSANFYAPFGSYKIQFRKWNTSSGNIAYLAEWTDDMPTTDGWYNMRIESVGNSHTCYLDGVELGTATDTTSAGMIESGYYGVYCWDMWNGDAAIRVDNWKVESLGGTTGIDDNDITQIPEEFILEQNYPNPFNPTTTISFDLSNSMNVSLSIFNVNGQLVRSLIDNNYSANHHTVTWNGKNNLGKNVPAGLYFYTLSGNATSVTKKMIYLK